jgi:hypothetical protein
MMTLLTATVECPPRLSLLFRTGRVMEMTGLSQNEIWGWGTDCRAVCCR